ncbi:MAG: type II CRISPR-associated endonuclease Cas1 [Bacteroidales bacterium]|jgi:CRISPR-associated protein Cas1|nr:type II CRISPR-associated endonuclease Cas1 [Bacteroidales bacterium]
MIKKTLYFGNPAYLSLRSEQIVIKLPEVEKCATLPDTFKQSAERTLPIEDVGVVVLNHKQITLTQGLIEKLLDNNVAIITCDSRRMPVGLMLPLSGNTTQSERFREQIDVSEPLKKQLWQQTIRAKITNQAEVLQRFRACNVKNMLHWAGEVRSGDTDNFEARAAAYYWSQAFPNIEHFTRDKEGTPPNNLLNYGYAILRAVVARALVASGLLPTLGIHHRNRYNAYCLADDMMEAYRPFVDSAVLELTNKIGYPEELTTDHKAHLLKIPDTDVLVGGRMSPLALAVAQSTASLYQCFSGETRKLKLPELP